jgi:cardiolipin synthase A/B
MAPPPGNHISSRQPITRQILARLLRRRYLFPWRADNRFELLLDGPVFFARMLQAIERARTYIFLEVYLMESGGVADRFISALAAAVSRGVVVYALLDDFGVRGLRPEDRGRMQAAGITVAFYNPLSWRKRLSNLLRDHRKLLLVDGEIAFVGGAGITDEFEPVQNPRERWRETMLQIEGPVLIDWHALFIATWRSARLGVLEQPLPTPATHPQCQRGRVIASARPRRENITRSVLVQIRRAQRRIWIATAYFVPARKLRRALTAAAQRGVEVRLLVPGQHTDHPAVRHASRRLYGYLLDHGIAIYEFQPRFLHAKVVLVDDWTSIGSSNLDRWNLQWNLEANQEVADAHFAESVATMFRGDFANASEIHRESWARRGWRSRILEAIAGQLDRWSRLLHR